MKGNRDRFHAGEDIFFPNPVSQMMFMIKKPVQKRTGFGIKNSKLELLESVVLSSIKKKKNPALFIITIS